MRFFSWICVQGTSFGLTRTFRKSPESKTKNITSLKIGIGVSGRHRGGQSTKLHNNEIIENKLSNFTYSIIYLSTR